MCDPVSIRSAASVTHLDPCLWCLETRMRKPTNSAMGTVPRMRWPRPTVSSYCAQSGIRDVVSLLGKVLDKLSVGQVGMLGVGSGVHTEGTTCADLGNVHGH